MRALLVLALAGAGLAPTAHAAEPVLASLCDHSTLLAGPTFEGRVEGTLQGAVVLAEATDARGGRVTCSVQGYGTHADPDLASVTSATTPGVAALPPSSVIFDTSDPWVVCTAVEVDGEGTYYYDTADKAWSTDPDATCGPYTMEYEEPFTYEWIDATVCPVLGGDLYVADTFVWDCPPYE
ncbi:MAG TPA: hypothetical protein VNQ77_14000 [Frankiaceae bacterium]|nr:hypothetical protein [Frankiaceae bacterium]